MYKEIDFNTKDILMKIFFFYERIEPEFPADFGRDKVIRKLIDTELDVQTLSKQLSTFADSLRYIREVSTLKLL